LTAGTGTLNQATAAWPTLVGVQLVVVGMLAGLGWRTHQMIDTVAPPPLEQRLQALDVPVAEAAVAAELKSARSGRALMPANERHLASFMSLSAQSAGLDVLEIGFAEGVPALGLVPVDVHIRLHGHVYDLPIFLNLGHNQRALGRLERVSVLADVGGAADMTVVYRFYRPEMSETDWIGDRLSTAAPGADWAVNVLEQAAQLQSWSQFRSRLSVLEGDVSAARAESEVSLPRDLIALWDHGGEMVWSLGKGVSLRSGG
jgi:hypothetical protein